MHKKNPNKLQSGRKRSQRKVTQTELVLAKRKNLQNPLRSSVYLWKIPKCPKWEHKRAHFFADTRETDTCVQPAGGSRFDWRFALEDASTFISPASVSPTSCYFYSGERLTKKTSQLVSRSPRPQRFEDDRDRDAGSLPSTSLSYWFTVIAMKEIQCDRQCTNTRKCMLGL